MKKFPFEIENKNGKLFLFHLAGGMYSLELQSNTDRFNISIRGLLSCSLYFKVPVEASGDFFIVPILSSCISCDITGECLLAKTVGQTCAKTSYIKGKQNMLAFHYFLHKGCEERKPFLSV